MRRKAGSVDKRKVGGKKQTPFWQVRPRLKGDVDARPAENQFNTMNSRSS